MKYRGKKGHFLPNLLYDAPGNGKKASGKKGKREDLASFPVAIARQGRHDGARLRPFSKKRAERAERKKRTPPIRRTEVKALQFRLAKGEKKNKGGRCFYLYPRRKQGEGEGEMSKRFRPMPGKNGI